MLRHYKRVRSNQQFSDVELFSVDTLVNYATAPCNYNDHPEVMRSFANVWVTADQIDAVINKIEQHTCCSRHQTRRYIYNYGALRNSRNAPMFRAQIDQDQPMHPMLQIPPPPPDAPPRQVPALPRRFVLRPIPFEMLPRLVQEPESEEETPIK